MPFARPTLQQIIARIQGDIGSRFGQNSSTLRRAWTSILSRAYGGAVHLAYGYLDFISKQMFSDTSDDDALIEEAGVYNIIRKPAQFADGNINVTGTVGKLVPAGAAFVRADGFRYILQSATSQSLPTTPYFVRAEAAGSIGNLIGAQPVTLESPIDGLSSIAAVASGGITGGFDQETIEELRSRLLLRKRNPPQGGSKTDYQTWALEVPGVAKAFVYAPTEIQALPPIPTFGYVYIYIATSAADPTAGAPLIAAVTAYINARKGATAQILVASIVPHTVNYVMNINLTPGFTLLQAQDEVTAELKDLSLREGLPQKTLRLSQINEAISSAVSENYHELTSPVADVVLAANEIAVVGTVTLNPF